MHGLIASHGNSLVNQVATGAKLETLKKEAASLPRIELSNTQ